ncbi:hypothetical protein FIBSPDRAFT_27992 [Athelia psychrophila]|uniref:Uncharacterized protein n=1 Tax=Athelia psychrophila TaxID=1759441 RepID=A0A166G6D8_9AGAM|nr:hypothetical protein FIBSPDRAFT_27992 [Fibularhizoctonia sp. CBS 109695]
MTHKRPFDAFNSPESSTPPRALDAPPLKRRLVSSSMHGPFIYSSPSTTASTSNTPYSQHSCHVTPSDSPTNPFGRIRKLALTAETLTLPRATSFSKHLPLRMQVVHVGARMHAKPLGEGTFRIVQVPLNYTFRHLKKLLDFLYTPDTSGKPLKTKPLPRRSGRGQAVPIPAVAKPKPKPKSKSAAPMTKYAGHLFEVQDSIRMYETAGLNLKPGHIRSAHTWAKLSAMRDPFRSGRADGLDFEREEGNVAGGEAEDEPIWEAEEDFTLGHVWPEGGDIQRGITYHHSATIQIHITMNRSKIPGRKGMGNKPFVFNACGEGFSSLPGEEGWGEEEDFDWEAPAESVYAIRWNNHEAFDRYLVREGKREGAYPHSARYDDEEREEFDADKSDLMLPPPTSSNSSSPLPFLPATTPAPSTRLHRLRVQYAAGRIERLNRKGIGELVVEVGDGDDDEDAEGEDELDGDSDGEVIRARSTEV